jgi:hypothetical protein
MYQQNTNEIRPEITLKIMELNKVEDIEFDEDYCLYAIIPLKRTSDNAAMYDSAFRYFLKQYVNDGHDVEDIIDQEPNLFLIIDDNDGEQVHFLQSFIKINDFGRLTEECLGKEIQLTDIEKARIDFALLKFSNPQEYLRQYTRQQFANRQEIKNRFGFVMDEIDEQRLYKSVWITPDYKICLIGCVPEVDNPKSKMQLLKIGA